MIGTDPEEVVEGVEDSSDDGKKRSGSFEKKAKLAGNPAHGTSTVTQ